MRPRLRSAICAPSAPMPVGMSTVPEVLVARHCGLRVCGISCITNLAAGMGEGLLSHEEVKETADRVKVDFIRLVTALTSRM